MKLGNYQLRYCSVCGARYAITSTGKSLHKCKGPIVGKFIHYIREAFNQPHYG